MKPFSRASNSEGAPGGEIAKLRPFLGTFVGIRVHASARGAASDAVTQAAAGAAIEAGFESVSEVHRLMSFFDPSSELSRLNRAGAGQWVALDPSLIEVLHAAKELEEFSGGAFNVAVAAGPGAFEVRGTRARRTRAEPLDLGGIAKGYAVDRAVDAVTVTLSAAVGLRFSGVVNAGGDLRVFGAAEKTIHLRAEAEAGPLLYALSLSDAAVATSSRSTGTFSVIAPRCLWADALTKVAASAVGGAAQASFRLERCLERFGARMIAFDSLGRPVEAA